MQERSSKSAHQRYKEGALRQAPAWSAYWWLVYYTSR